MKELTLYRCAICGNLICMLQDSGVVPECCGEAMTRIVANTEDASTEKHVPVTRRDGTRVQTHVGESPHPMTPQHHISMIFLLTNEGLYVRRLNSGGAAEAQFNLCLGEDVRAVYAWCNIHGLWKS